LSAAEQLALFEPLPPLAPAWPTPHTQAAHALNRLLAGDTLDHPTFEAATGSWRLAAVVFELRVLGWPVQTTDKPAPAGECPSRTIAVYSLSAYDLADLLAIRGGERT
jgi:hypothetical protein